MTLKEKSENLFLQFRNANLSTWINDADAKKMSVITMEYAEDFAIEFAEWIWGNCFNIFNDRFLYKDDEYSTKELLEIYKKEKGL